MKRVTVVMVCILVLFIAAAMAPAALAGQMSDYTPVTPPFSETAELTDACETPVSSYAYTKGYVFSAEAGEVVTITLDSDDFDALLYLLDEEEIALAQDDDGGGGSNSKLVYKLTYSGTYYVHATQYTLDPPGETGSFEISITLSEAEESDETIFIQFATPWYPDDIYFLEINGDPRSLDTELEQTVLAVYGMIWRGEAIYVPVDWRYDDFDSGMTGIRMITGDVSLPDGYEYMYGALTVESPVLVYDPDGAPVEVVSDLVHNIFYDGNIIPLGMAAADMEARLYDSADEIMRETAGGYSFWVDVSIDPSIVDSSAVGVYYPVTLHLPLGVGFGSDDFRRPQMAVYVLDPEEVDLRAAETGPAGFEIYWLKGVAEPELRVSMDGGDWQNVMDGGDWLELSGIAEDYWKRENVLQIFFPSDPPYYWLNLDLSWFRHGHVYDFDIRYENDGFSVNFLRVDLTGAGFRFELFEGDRTGGDRYQNPWDVITGDSGNSGNSGNNGGNAWNGGGYVGGNTGNGGDTELPDASGDGDKSTEDPQSDSDDGDDTDSPQSPDDNEDVDEQDESRDDEQDAAGTEPGDDEQGSTAQTSNDAEGNAQQLPPQAGNLILEPANPLNAANAGAASNGESASQGGAALDGDTSDGDASGDGITSGLSAGLDGGVNYNLGGNDDPMELKFDFPFDDFDGFYVDGELWAPGVDYTARPGSTIITISAERLARLGAGVHALTAVFAGVPVEVELTVNAPDPEPIPQTPVERTSGVTQIELPEIIAEILTEPSLRIEQMTPASAFPALPLVIGVVILGFGICLVYFILRRKVLADK